MKGRPTDDFLFVTQLPRYHFFVQCSCMKVLSGFYLIEGVIMSDRPAESKKVVNATCNDVKHTGRS